AILGAIVGLLVARDYAITAMPIPRTQPLAIRAVLPASDELHGFQTLLRQHGELSVTELSDLPGSHSLRDELLVLLPSRELTARELATCEEHVRGGGKLWLLIDEQTVGWARPLAERFQVQVEPALLDVESGAITSSGRRVRQPAWQWAEADKWPLPSWNLHAPVDADLLLAGRSLAGRTQVAMCGVTAGEGRLLVLANADWLRDPAIVRSSRASLMESGMQWLVGLPSTAVPLRWLAIALALAVAVVAVGWWLTWRHTQLASTFVLATSLSVLAMTWTRAWVPSPMQVDDHTVLFSADRTFLDVPGAAPVTERMLSRERRYLDSGELRVFAGRQLLQSTLDLDKLPRVLDSMSEVGSSQAWGVVVVEPLYYLPETTIRELKQYVRSGGRLWVLCSSQATPAAVNELMLGSGLTLSEQTVPASRLHTTAGGLDLPLPVDAKLRTVSGGVPLIMDEQGNIATAGASLGRGQIILASIADSLQDDQWTEDDARGRLWRWLLEREAKHDGYLSKLGGR
ncbi:MAG: hypothetical protein KDB14_09125, partial [Planctomycetales bacterium]|nr:hypothetical protein [Planctomycetales bacterium]